MDFRIPGLQPQLSSQFGHLSQREASPEVLTFIHATVLLTSSERALPMSPVQQTQWQEIPLPLDVTLAHLLHTLATRNGQFFAGLPVIATTLCLTSRTSSDPSAGSPTETLLRLLLPLNEAVWASSQ
jgi:hypothetical protein